MRKPLIVVTTPDNGGTASWLCIKLGILLAGGKALRASPSNPPDLHLADGLVVSGGADVFPELYGQEKLEEERQIETSLATFWVYKLKSACVAILLLLLRRVFSLKQRPQHDRQRDSLETALIQQAIKQGLPVLGICRGMQLLNVVRGGTLHQSIVDFYEDVRHPNTVLPHKKVHICNGSKLQCFFTSPTIMVNALHRQAVDKLGINLSVSAMDEAGVPQAIMDEQHPFFVGVQWHPEYLLQLKSQRHLFASLVYNAKEYRRTASGHTKSA
ncbi:gamma-glutamyl-gamma-aminobutyrate hydrolase family protein [Oleidesulfovibrio sp.]|uniref:gamma-glutamyl-gamma-aminobutyrate hydrolase family protein n=1 Tax=Oleidesulfovibrio sp. TaxID=2909707 RepID=UPI003A85E054